MAAQATAWVEIGLAMSVVFSKGVALTSQHCELLIAGRRGHARLGLLETLCHVLWCTRSAPKRFYQSVPGFHRPMLASSRFMANLEIVGNIISRQKIQVGAAVARDISPVGSVPCRCARVV